MQILKYMLGVMLVLLAASPSFAYTTLDDLEVIKKDKYCYISGDGKNGINGDCLGGTVSSLTYGMWGVPMLDDEDRVDLVGNSACVDYKGDVGQAADNQSYFTKPDDGEYCYCQMTGPETSAWMFADKTKDYKTCISDCAGVCGDFIHDDTQSIRSNMFKTVDYGGGSSGGDDYSWLYDTAGTDKGCYVDTAGDFEDDGCPSGTDKIITEPRQWAAVLDSKEHPQTLVTGTAWVSNDIDTNKPYVGYIPTDPKTIQVINDEYASYNGDDNLGASYCYCKMETPAESSWVYLRSDADLEGCTADCARYTSKRGGSGSDETDFTDAMFSTLKSAAGGMSMVVTTQNYVDDLLNLKQEKFIITGTNNTNKLMTFGTGTGSKPFSRNIVSTLGTSTNATTVPETGPIVAGINSKQDAVNGTANFVMTGTGTAGTLGEKPVYSTTNNYSNALVTAQTINTAATNAANGEMSCNTYVENAAQTPANCLLWQIVQSAPTGLALTNPDLMSLIGASSDGDYYAVRDNAGNDMNGNASTYGLSSSDHNSFAVDYGSAGVVRGHGRCSTRAGTDPWPWNKNNNTYEYETISTNFVDTLTDETGQSGAQYCYCGLDSYTPLNGGGQSLSGPWVFINDLGYDYYCLNYCAYFCASTLMSDVGFRAAVFNAYE